MMSKNNPLRISQESLDLDDIISDLNSETSKAEQQKPQAKKPTSLQAQRQAKQAAGVQKPANKENDSSLANRMHATESTVLKQKGMTEAKEIALQQTKATTSEKLTTRSEAAVGNQRYADETISKSSLCDMHGMDENTEEQLRNPVPFYLKGSQQISNDEDVESFQRKLDMMIVNFRSETMSEFMKTKKQVLTDQAQTIDGERRRCNTLLAVKQSEIEQLKEGLAQKTKGCEDLNQRCEGMAFWAGKSKMLLRIKLLQHRAFQGLKQFRDFQQHSKRVLAHKLKQHRQNLKRSVFQGWGKQYRAWKIVKNKDDFEKAVKLELQQICAQYNKEIEGLRDKLNEAQAIADNHQRNKAMMEDNLKKIFMRQVCQLNYEAMNVLNPHDQHSIEREMERQVSNALNGYANPYQSQDFMTGSSQGSESDYSQRTAPIQSQTEGGDYRKIESKDSMWKPAPIMGREINPSSMPTFTYNQPTITSQLKGNTQQNVVLSSHFNRFVNAQANNSDLNSVMPEEVKVVRIEEDTERRTIPGNPTTIQSSSLPDFIGSGMQSYDLAHGQGEGKTIVVSQPKPVSSTKQAPVSKKAAPVGTASTKKISNQK